VTIRASSSKQIDLLLADLRSPDAVTREAAVARLTVIGSRAVDRLIALAESAGERAAARSAAWRTLEAIGDPRALDPALRALASTNIDAEAGAAASSVARVFVRGPRGAAVVDGLTSVALDRSRPDGLRLAALRALRTLEPATIAPLLASLADDPSAVVRRVRFQADQQRAASALPQEREPFRGSPKRDQREGGSRAIADAAERALPDDPDALRAAIAHGDDVPLQHLVRIVERVRVREGAEPAARRDRWRKVRGAAHVALAKRGSRLALHDLRESLERRVDTMPVELATALSLIGDASCLEAIAAAHAKTRDPWWRQHLADAFYTIVTREKLTQRHAVMKRIAKKWTLA
jgi:HEAT repeat protein